MKKRLMLFLSCLFLSLGFISAQVTKASGVVVDESGEPVIGASVIVKGTQIGVSTDIDGKFAVEAPIGNVILRFSLIGMLPVEQKASSQMRVVMKDDTKQLEQVVVTGYGNFSKSSFTGSASTLNTDKVKDVPGVSLASRLSGSIAGLSMTSTSGQPGAAETIRIRGVGSINAGSNPLYVIDGVAVGSSNNASEFTYSQSGTSILSTLNPSDIESITVIKDAAAASLYGSRAANGVIVITTKQGTEGKTKVNFKADWGYSNFAINYRPTLSGDERKDLLYKGLYNYYLGTGKDEAASIAFAENNIGEYASKPQQGWANWKDFLLRTGSAQNYEVSVQGGNSNTKFYTSLSYTDQQGVTISSDYKRYTGRLSVTHKADKLTLDGSVLVSNSKQSTSSEGTSYASPIMAVFGISTSPSFYPYDVDGNFTYENTPLSGNALESAKLNYNYSDLNRSLSSLTASYILFDGLNILERLNIDNIDNQERVWWDPRSNDGRAADGVMQIVRSSRRTVSTQTQLSYNKTYAIKHHLDALLGFETEDYKYSYGYLSGNGYPAYDKPEIANAANKDADSRTQRSRQLSYLARLNYNFDNRYYLGASYRTDGLSRLADGSHWGSFYSLSASWRLSQEKFWAGLQNILSDSKLRFSYGTNGTRPDKYYSYMGVFSYGWNYGGMAGSAESRLANPDLKWEKNASTNIGLDLTIIDRISLSLDFYNRDTRDLLYDRLISQTTGISTRLENIGKMQNRGFEVEIKSNNITNKDFTWSTTFSISHNKNKVKKLNGIDNEEISGVNIRRVGESFYSFYGYKYAGVDPATGKESFYLNDGTDGITTDPTLAKKDVIGSADPDLQGGLGNFIKWKDFDFGMTLTYSIGGKIYDDARWMQSNGGSYNYISNVPSYYKIEDMWQKPGDNAKLPQFVYGNTNTLSSRWLMSSDHIRIKNITFGYTLPSAIVRKASISNLRVFASGSNVLTWKKKDTYLDPESPVDGIVTFETPSMRTITFGIEIGF